MVSGPRSHPSLAPSISTGVWHAQKKPGFNETRPPLPACHWEPATAIHLPQGEGTLSPCRHATLGTAPAAPIPAKTSGRPGCYEGSSTKTIFLSAPIPTQHPSLPPLKSQDLAWERCLWAFHKSSIPLNQNQLAWPKVLPLKDCPFFSNPCGLNCSKEPGCE